MVIVVFRCVGISLVREGYEGMRGVFGFCDEQQLTKVCTLAQIQCLRVPAGQFKVV